MAVELAVLTQAYPSVANRYSMSYVHSRNIYYTAMGVEPQVFSFECKDAYTLDGISVDSASRLNLDEVNNIAIHAPNLRNHFRLIQFVSGKRISVFFHGHEVLRTRDYPVPYPWVKPGAARQLLKDSYDTGKLAYIRWALKLLAKRNNVSLIFVSGWMKDQFIQNIGPIPEEVESIAVIPNSASPILISNEYRHDPQRLQSDFVTMRPLDSSKYAIDLVVDCAQKMPDQTFTIFGKGDYFKFNICPDNLNVIDSYLSHEEMPEILDQFKAALMPTRFDAQGVMACEIASYGMPIVSSSIPIVEEMIGSYPGSRLLPNERFAESLCELDHDFFATTFPKLDNFDGSNLASSELDILLR